MWCLSLDALPATTALNFVFTPLHFGGAVYGTIAQEEVALRIVKQAESQESDKRESAESGREERVGEDQEGAKEEGIVYLECLKNLNGRLHFTFVGVDVCDIAETRLIVHGSDERMTEKADHLQKLIDFKKDNSPPKE